MLRTHKSELAEAEPGPGWNRGTPGSAAGGSKHSAQLNGKHRSGELEATIQTQVSFVGKKGGQETDCQEPEVLKEVCVGSGLMQGRFLGSGKLHCFPEFLCHSKQVTPAKHFMRMDVPLRQVCSAAAIKSNRNYT